MRIYFITGISGSGKTTVARKLLDLGYVAFDSKVTTGIFHFEDKDGKEPTQFKLQDKAWMEKYKWVLNKSLLDELLIQHKNEDCVFLCGTGNVLKFKEIAERVFVLLVDKATLVNRLNSPTRDNLFGKDDITRDLILSRMETTQKLLLNAGAIPIEATKPIDEVVAEILSKIT
jgi:adenylate kinase family enzyme